MSEVMSSVSMSIEQAQAAEAFRGLAPKPYEKVLADIAPVNNVEQLLFDASVSAHESVGSKLSGMVAKIGKLAMQGVERVVDTVGLLKIRSEIAAADVVDNAGPIVAHGALASLALAGAAGMVARDSTPVEAYAVTLDEYAPNRSGNSLVGWVNVRRDCSNTVGCYNYAKIEKRNPKRWEFWEPWLYVGGNWVSKDGWNSITTGLPAGCGDYRTTVTSYNEVTGDQSSSISGGVNIGSAGVSSSGLTLYWIRSQPMGSDTHYICR